MRTATDYTIYKIKRPPIIPGRNQFILHMSRRIFKLDRLGNAAAVISFFICRMYGNNYIFRSNKVAFSRGKFEKFSDSDSDTLQAPIFQRKLFENKVCRDLSTYSFRVISSSLNINSI